MSTESTFFDLLLTAGSYLILVIVLLVALYLARRWRRGRTGASIAPPRILASLFPRARPARTGTPKQQG